MSKGDGFDFFENYEPPERKRDDEAQAKLWRGPLFKGFRSPMMWKDESYQILDRPHYVTFPICALCRHIIWNDPHFGEEPPKEEICDACFEAESNAPDYY